jgi:hypothetical protein
MKTLAAALLLLLAAGSTIAADYTAPNGGLTARVMAAAPQSCESVVEISAGSSVIGAKSYASDNHEDGSCVAHAAWTADSKFFVFSLSNSGGHQPWNSPIVIFSVEKTKFTDIDVGDKEAITDPNFILSTPSRIEFETTKFPLEENTPERQRADLRNLRGLAKD